LRTGVSPSVVPFYAAAAAYALNLPYPTGGFSSDPVNIPPMYGVVVLAVVLVVALILSLRGAEQWKLGIAFGLVTYVAMILLSIFSQHPPSPIPLTSLFLIGIGSGIWTVSALANHFQRRKWKVIAASWGIFLVTAKVVGILIGQGRTQTILLTLYDWVIRICMITVAFLMLTLFVLLLVTIAQGLWQTLFGTEDDEETNERKGYAFSKYMGIWFLTLMLALWIAAGLKAVISEMPLPPSGTSMH
jgi:Ni/Fe-hydrogenase subunit HybB-like protein